MANSKIYFTPSRTGYGGLRVIDFGERVSDLQITPYRNASDSVSMGGSFSRIARRSGMRVRIVLERFTDDRLAEQFYSLQSHLEAGGGFSFAVDNDKKFAAFINSAAAATVAGGHRIFTHDPLILAEYGAHGLAANDVIHMESFGPRGRREEMQVDSYSSSDKKITTSSDAIYEHSLPSMVRHRDFFPFLLWPQDQMGSPILTHDHRISYTLDMTCEVYPGNIQAAYAQSGTEGSNIPTTTGRTQDGVTLDELHIGPLYGDSVDISGGSKFDLSLDEMSPLERAVNAMEKFE
jgi:hypothetical protein|tara:strand:- start:74 stop:949 length:876 start_codon:yes stop_codon:yes gene_type:complete